MLNLDPLTPLPVPAAAEKGFTTEATEI